MAYLDFGDSPSPSSALPKRYLISLGSNIDPQKHVPLALEEVADHAGLIVLSRAIETAPVGMDSQNRFLNLVAFLETSLEAPRLKATFNAIETALGRDRTDPLSKVKDRPIDLDILAEVQTLEDVATAITTCPTYCQAILLELLHHLLTAPDTTIQKTQEFRVGEAIYGLAPKKLAR
jgi:2-amino-4-hydroxy-6-hydroxymethyldihydropteridine diphosphokinase